MDWKSTIYSNVISNWIARLIEGGVVFFVITYLKSLDKSKINKWLSALLYGFVAMVSVIAFFIIIDIQNNIFKEQQLKTTKENVEHKVRDWIDDYQLPVTNTINNNDFFQYHTELSKSVTVDIERRKESEKFLTISAVYDFQTIKEHMDKTTNKQLISKLINQMRIETSKLGLLLSTNLPRTDVYIISLKIPIDEKLTETEFINGLYHVEAAVLTVKNIGLYDI